MGRLRDLGWAIRDRLGGTAVAVVLALGGLGAGVAGLAVALDAQDKAEEATTSTAAAPLPATTAPDAGASAKVDELNERVAAIEESVAKLRTEVGEAAPTDTGETATPEAPTVPETPELPEGIEVPGVPAPEGGAPPKP